MSDELITIEPARFSDDTEAVRALFTEYRETAEAEICFDSFQSELDQIETSYQPPAGGLLVARTHDEIIGCVGWRHLDDHRCEIRRLFVKADFRGRGLGRQLTTRVLDAIRALGIQQVELHTLARMEAAVAMYQSLDFAQVNRTEPIPHIDVIFFEKDLAD